MSVWDGNDREELDPLVGATIIGVDLREDEYGDSFWRLHVRYRDGLRVNDNTEGFYELWRDEEGNGPGYLAFLGSE